MSKIALSVPHHLTQQEALQRIKGLLEQIKRENGDKVRDLHEEWTVDGGTFQFTVMGFAISGSVAVTPTEVQVAGDLPFAASFFQRTIESTIRERAAELLA